MGTKNHPLSRSAIRSSRPKSRSELFWFLQWVYLKTRLATISDCGFQFQKILCGIFYKHTLPWSILQPLWKKDFLLSLNGFDESFSRLQDVELHTRALMDHRVRYLLFPGDPDCYYRISEDRKNFKPFIFMERWVDSAVKYSAKFGVSTQARLRRFLTGTLYQTYLQLLFIIKVE